MTMPVLLKITSYEPAVMKKKALIIISALHSFQAVQKYCPIFSKLQYGHDADGPRDAVYFKQTTWKFSFF